MRQQIKKVMRFSGPRMNIYHPVMAVRHLIESKREKKRLERKMNVKKIVYTAVGCLGLGLEP